MTAQNESSSVADGSELEEAGNPAAKADELIKEKQVQEAARNRYPAAYGSLVEYRDLLASQGVLRGLIGPREVDRLWDRHILNCAASAELELGLVLTGSSVVDVGSGAGLPGLVWAIVRQDITVTLLESMQRRVDFLELAVDELGLADRVGVRRARAEDVVGEVSSAVVTARAVAPLTRLVGWLAPLATPGGSVVALKGSSVEDELVEAAPELDRLRAGFVEVITVGDDWLSVPTQVVVIKDFSQDDARALAVAKKPGKKKRSR